MYRLSHYVMFLVHLCWILELPHRWRGWGGRGGGWRGWDVLWGATDRDGRGSPGAGDGDDTEAVEW